MNMNEEIAIPPCDIRIDKDGVWYYQGVEMIRKDIVNYFYENLKRDEYGRYLIEIKDDRCYLEVEDTAFVVKEVRRSAATEKGAEDFFSLLLSDDTSERLDLETLHIGTDDIPYCEVKGRQFEARISRPAYYQIARFFEYDPERESYYIAVAGDRRYISRRESARK